jgi:hypothetical protein
MMDERLLFTQTCLQQQLAGGQQACGACQVAANHLLSTDYYVATTTGGKAGCNGRKKLDENMVF